MKLKEIARNAIWYGVVPRLTILITVLITPLITPYMTPGDYGMIGIISAYVGLITGFSTLGLHVHFANSYYEYKTRFAAVWRRLVFWMVVGSIICMLISMVLLWFELPDTTPWPRLLIIFLGSISILFNFNIMTAQHYYGIRLLPKPLVIRKVIASIIGLVVMFVCVYFFRWGYMGYVFQAATVSVVLFVLFFKPLWIDLRLYPLPHHPNARVKDWFKIALPMLPHNIGHVMLASSDRIIMGLLLISTHDIGIYTNGYTFGEYGGILITALISSLAPVLQTTCRNKNHKQMRKIFIFNEIVALAIILILSIWMREIYQLLVRNQELQISHTVAALTCFSYAMFPLYTILSIPVFVEKKTTKILWLVFMPALINIVLNFIFIPIYGYRAAIITTVISYWSISILVLMVPFFRENLRNWLGNPLKILWLPAICIIVLLLAQLIGGIPTTPKIVLTGAALIVITYFIKRNWNRITNFTFDHKDIIE